MSARKAIHAANKNPTVGKMLTTRLLANWRMDTPSPPVALYNSHIARGTLTGIVAVIAAISLLCFCRTATARMTPNAIRIRKISCQLTSDLIESFAPQAAAIKKRGTGPRYWLPLTSLAWLAGQAIH